MDKQSILNHIDDLTAEQLANFIIQGVVSLKELKETLNLDRSKSVAISSIIKKYEDDKRKVEEEQDRADSISWDAIRYSNEFALIEWIGNNPTNKYIQQAKNRINFLEEERSKIRKEKQAIFDKIKSNPNYYNPNKIIEFIKNGTINEQDLLNCDIPQSAIDNLGKIKTPVLQLGETPTSIPEGFTEVYFWGGVGSGKTCALGAVLQVAQKKGYLNIAPGDGYLYANQLKNIFSDNGKANDFLPAPSPVETTQYLPFTLKRPNESKSRSVSLIELSGEIFECFFNINANMQFPSASHEKTFNTLNVFLNSNNRKIHFFFIDYDKKNRPDEDSLTQSDYLSATSTYFQNNKVFGNTTDAIFIVLTKSDLILDEDGNSALENKVVDYAIKHINDNYFAFKETLKNSCKKYGINGGILTVEPFSLGRVYFKEICDFDSSAASNIVEILMKRIPTAKNSLLDIFNK